MSEVNGHATVIKLGDREYDLRGALPLTLGDWEAFDKFDLLQEGQLEITHPTQVINALFVLLHKIDHTVTRDVVTGIPMTDMPKLGIALGVVLGGGGGGDTENPSPPDPIFSSS